MSGGYTYITLARRAIEEVRNRREGLLRHEAIQALGYWKKFCIVGARLLPVTPITMCWIATPVLGPMPCTKDMRSHYCGLCT